MPESSQSGNPKTKEDIVVGIMSKMRASLQAYDLGDYRTANSWRERAFGMFESLHPVEQMEFKEEYLKVHRLLTRPAEEWKYIPEDVKKVKDYFSLTSSPEKTKSGNPKKELATEELKKILTEEKIPFTVRRTMIGEEIDVEERYSERLKHLADLMVEKHGLTGYSVKPPYWKGDVFGIEFWGSSPEKSGSYGEIPKVKPRIQEEFEQELERIAKRRMEAEAIIRTGLWHGWKVPSHLIEELKRRMESVASPEKSGSSSEKLLEYHYFDEEDDAYDYAEKLSRAGYDVNVFFEEGGWVVQAEPPAGSRQTRIPKERPPRRLL